MSIRAIVAGLLMLSVVAGCQAPPEPQSPTVARISSESPDTYDQLSEAAASSLRGRFFRLDRQDRLEGVITTYPDTSPISFELWRPQPLPAYYLLETNVQTIQRQATVHIRPVSASEYELSVEIERSRYSLPERQIDNSAAALRIFSGAAPTQTGRMEHPSESGYWIPLGRDGPMEERLVQAIIQRYQSMPVEVVQPAANTQPVP